MGLRVSVLAVQLALCLGDEAPLSAASTTPAAGQVDAPPAAEEAAGPSRPSRPSPSFASRIKQAEELWANSESDLEVPRAPTGLADGTIVAASLQLPLLAAKDAQQAEELWELRNLLGSIQLLLRSAQRGHKVAEYCFRWGQYHELPPSDMAQALRWYRRGARMNHLPSITMIGKLAFVQGQRQMAENWWGLIASPLGARPRVQGYKLGSLTLNSGLGGATGDSLAQWFLAESCKSTERHREAVRWWKRCAANGDTDAMMRLVDTFSSGAPGIPREDERAKYWLSAAAALGDKRALSEFFDNRTESAPASTVERSSILKMERQGWM
eukprot:TRINITY_DN42304_c0_g1_i1.p1 TRINITY_DN42304_c0_g1~~TRINITY_DN42304_c0_g1_i1.p1  ORF type:complete len:326 (+),score=67.74 TRINITY_DN42304_c0_g1_i1:70-1047(+)